MQITLPNARRSTLSPTRTYDTPIILNTFTGNTSWLLGNSTTESIDINEIIPAAIQESHKKWVKTIFNASKNIRGSWSNLSSMLSRPIKIFNPSTHEENLVSIEMTNAEANETDEQITLSVTITKLMPISCASPEKALETSALNLSSRRKRAIFFESLLQSSPTQSSMLERSDKIPERSQTLTL